MHISEIFHFFCSGGGEKGRRHPSRWLGGGGLVLIENRGLSEDEVVGGEHGGREGFYGEGLGGGLNICLVGAEISPQMLFSVHSEQSIAIGWSSALWRLIMAHRGNRDGD